MPNRKIKHIVAKLVGASTEEMLDVYDIDAVHTSDVANNLTTTNAGYVLDARQGKALNDSLTPETVSTGITDVTGYRVGRICFLNIDTSGTTCTANTWNTLGSLPTKLHPISTVRCLIYDSMHEMVLDGNVTHSNGIRFYTKNTTVTLRGTVAYVSRT